jgi:branched-chain amino acid transport system permease protein
MSVLGGTRHWAGPVVGSVVITCLLYFFTSGSNPVLGKAAVGLILVVVILFLPNGILWYLLNRKKSVSTATNKPTPSTQTYFANAQTTPQNHHTEPPSSSKSHTVLLEVQGLSKAFTGVQALSDVSLQVYQGEILGLLGPNGSGKSTFINVVSGHYPLSGGSIVFEGQPLNGLQAHQIAQAGIARTYQIPRPFAHLTVLQNVALVAMFGGNSLSQAQASKEAYEWLAFAHLDDKAHAFPDELNLHQRKFLELARALAGRPRLVLLDEVLSGLTPSEINEAIALIRKIHTVSQH